MVTMIYNVQNIIVPYCTYDSRKMVVTGRSILKNNAILQPKAFIQQVTQTQCIQHPVTHVTVIDIILIVNVVRIIFAVTYNLNAEDIENGSDVVGERSRSQLFSLIVHGAAQPKALKFFQGERTVALQRLQQPNITFEISL